MIDIDLGAVLVPGIDDETRMDAWEMSVAQAGTAEALTLLEARLYRRLELLRQREHSPHIERDALALIARRRKEIAIQAMGNAAWP